MSVDAKGISLLIPHSGEVFNSCMKISFEIY